MHLTRRIVCGLSLLLGFCGSLLAGTYVEWSQAPSDVDSGAQYTVEAHGWDDSGNLSEVDLYRNGSWDTYSTNGNGWDIWVSDSPTDTGEQWIDYSADAYDDYGGDSGTIYTTVHVRPPNNPPTIEWSSAPTEVASGQSYYVEAHGHDADGNLTTVSVWRNDSPYAFAGGGNGTDGYSGNPSTDTGEQYITYKAQAGDSNGATSSFIYLTVHIQPPNQPPTISWTNCPAGVDHNTWYTMRADAHDPDNNMTTVNIYRKWQPFAFELNGNQTDAYSDNPDYAGDPAGSTIEYEAEASDSAGATSGYIYFTVTVNNYPPLNGWNPSDVGTVYINGTYGSTASGSDPDGNLKEVRVYSSYYEYEPDGSVTSYGPVLYDTISSGDGGPVSRGYTWQAAKPYQRKYVWSNIAEDQQGVTGLIWSVSGGDITTQNRPPQPPTLNSNNTSIGLGESITISANGSDDDENAMNQYIWYQGPSDGPNDWHSLTISSYSNGTGNTVANYTFTPTELGTYHFKTRVDDPYASSNDVTVDLQVEDRTPPNPPSSVSVTDNQPDWVYLSWTPSDSGDVASQHIFWQQASGGSTHEVIVGFNVSGCSITGLTASTAYNFYIEAEDGAGNYSSPSNTASATTPWWYPPTITSQPVNQNRLVGQSVTFSVSVSSNPPATFQWRKNGVNISGATGSSLTLNNLQRTDHGTYSVAVTNAGGTVDSNGAVLLVGVTGDTDGDGMPDSWETAHNLNPNDPNDALLDPDNDGLTNIAEYNLGKDPNTYDAGTSSLGGTIPAGWPSAGDTSNTKAVGATAGTLAVDKSGALTYTVPLWVTPGTAGMQPQLQLSYSSEAGPGLAGFGWSLTGMSQITRGPRTRAVDGVVGGVHFDANDRFYLDGQRLIAISGNDGADGTEYRTEIDSLSRVISHGANGSGPAWFEGRTKAGLVIEFGHTTDSAFDTAGSTGVLTWSVSKISDTAGNYMTFTYTKDSVNGTQVLARIDYTGNANASPAVTPYASVQFTYEARTDTFSGYRAGCLVANTQRLKSVVSYYGTFVARTYTLNYTNTGPSNRSILSSITESGKDGSAYPDLTFQYQANSPGWQTQTAAPWVPPTPTVTLQGFNGTPTQYGTGFVDLDGDGRPDFVQNYWDVGSSTTTAHAWLNKSTGWVAAEGGSQPDFRPPYALGYSNNNDSSARFVDFDGDGRPDILWNHVDGNGVTESGAYRNNGAGWTSVPAYTPPITLAYDKDTSPRGVYFIDLNGDGRVDLIANGAGNVYLNSGSGWTPAGSAWNAPCNLAHGVAFVDINGDGLPDIVQNWYSNYSYESGIWLNTGNGWSAQQALPAGFPLLNAGDPTWGTNSPMGVEFVDLNGDGLVDAIGRNDAAGNLITPQVWFNTGAGFVEGPSNSPYNPPIELRHDHESTGVAFLDVNGDGLPDLVQSYQGTSSVYYNTGHGWGPQTTGGPALTANIYASGWHNQNQTDLVDLDGDGIVDQCGYWLDNGSHQAAARNLSSPTQDRLTKVTNGFGVSATVVYKPLTDSTVYTKGSGATFPNMDLISPMEVVSTVKNDDGAGGTYDVDYKYGGLKANADRGSLGFQWMSVTDSRTGIATTTWFHQDFPFIGMASQSETKSGTTTLALATTTLVDHALNGGKTHLPYAQEAVQQSWDLNGAYVSGSDTTTQIDDYGNATQVTVAGIDAAGSANGFEKTTSSSYSNNTTNWFLGRLLTSTVLSHAPATPDITRTSAYRYDTTTGLLTDEAVEPVLDSTGNLVADYTAASGYGVNTVRTHYEYDAFGNKTAARVGGLQVTVDASGNVSPTSSVEIRSTTTTFDANGRLPTGTTNALSQSETYDTYDQELGVATQITGPNHLSTSWTIDGFGQKTHESRADGTGTDFRRKWAGAAGGTVPAGALYQVETESTGSAPAIEFYDSFGRSIRSLAINGNGYIVYQDTQYDSMGRAYKKSNPYLNDGNTVYWSETTSYDLLNRPLITQTPDDEVAQGYVQTGYTYNGLVVSVTDPAGRRADTTKNSEGWITQVVRNAGASASANDYSAVTYQYDALGEVTQTTAAGVATTIHYDLRGRKDQMTDPDMGVWLYRYNPFGELIWQKDAKGQIVTMGYDALGRMRTRTETEGTTTWTYDTTWVGKIGSVASPNGYSENYGYDPYGRPYTDARTIDGTQYTISETYDSAGRPQKTIYPTGFQIQNAYNAFGFLKEIRRADNGKNNLYWQANGYAIDGRVDSESYGNGLVNDRSYSRATGRLTAADIDAGIVTQAPYAIQQLTYTHDAVGNVHTRADASTNRSEVFTYDGLDRLTDYSLSGATSASAHVDYDQKGNITNKTGVNGFGSYAYNYTPSGRTNALPHAVSQAGSNSYTYDADGNMTGGAGRTISWTSFNQVSSVSDASGHSSAFTFDAAHQRVKQVANWGTTIYVGGIFEHVTMAGGGVVNKHYIIAPSGRVAVYEENSDATTDVRYFHTDGLGSMTAVTDEYGFIVKRFAFDPWGARMTVDNTTLGTTNTTSTNNGNFTRGFTDHEQLDDLNLVHMNGRVYDPVLGRFLSADPFVGNHYDSQDYNRFSYVGNNPLGSTDPSGYFSLKDVGIIAAVVVAAIVTAGVAVYAAGVAMGYSGMTLGFSMMSVMTGEAATWGAGWAAVMGAGAGFGSAFAGSLLNGGSVGDAFKAGVIGAAVGAVSAGIASKIGDFAEDNEWFQGTGQNLAHGVLQGSLTEATGGQFRHGFYAGFGSSALAGPVSDLAPGGRMGQTVAAAVVGGTASAVGGGKFANGAVSGAFTYLFNHAAHDTPRVDRRDWLDRLSDFAAGFGDTVTFGVTRILRDRVFTNFYKGTVDYASTSYTVGEVTGVAVQTVAAGVGGYAAAGELAETEGAEFSHWIPNRWGGPRSLFNGNFVTAEEHALSDPFRYRFMSQAWKLDNPMPNMLVQQLSRIPYVYTWAAAGAAAGGGGAATNELAFGHH